MCFTWQGHRRNQKKNLQFLHIFDPSFIAGQHGSRIEQKYVTPITAATQAEIFALYPEDPEQAKVIDVIRESFYLSEHDFGYEIKLREVLSDIWIQLLQISRPLLEEKGNSSKANDKIKSMMVYVHEHYGEKKYQSQRLLPPLFPVNGSASGYSMTACIRHRWNISKPTVYKWPAICWQTAGKR